MAKRKYYRRDSGLLLPDDSLIAPNVNTPRPWYAGRLDSRRWMSRRKCCCDVSESCTIFSDEFTTDDLAENWTEISGEWSIGSGVLSTSDSDAILTCNTTLTPFENHAVVAKINLGTYNSGKKVRILFNYIDTDNYNYAEFWYNSTYQYQVSVKVVSRVGGVDTTASTVNGLLDSYPTGSYLLTYIKICITATSVAVAVAMANESWVSAGGQWIAIDSTVVSCGVGNAGTVGVTFDYVTLYRLETDTEHCIDCFVCSYCNAGTLANQYQITIAGMSCPGGSPDTGDGTFVLEPKSACFFSMCENLTNPWIRTASLWFNGSTIFGEYYVGPVDWNCNGTWPIDDWPSCDNHATRMGFLVPPVWSHTFTSVPYDCDFTMFQLETYVANNADTMECDYSGVTFHISSV
jgi:hypothetical protein